MGRATIGLACGASHGALGGEPGAKEKKWEILDANKRKRETKAKKKQK